MRKPDPAQNAAIMGLAAPPLLQVRAPQFEGSLSLLIRLAQDKRVPLLDIPLAPIALSYLDFLSETQPLDLEGAGAALLGIAYLIERKASLMLPQEPPPQEDDILDLIEPTGYLFAPVVSVLEERLSERQRLFFRQPDAPQEPYQLPIEFGELKSDDLAAALKRLLENALPPENDHKANRPHFSLREKMEQMIAQISRANEPLPFESFLSQPYTRLEVVWVFLAMLELLKLSLFEVAIYDEKVYLSAKKAVVQMEVSP